jgi:hypothetical protein
MRFIDNEMAIPQREQLVHDTHDLLEWRNIAVHTIHCLYSDEDVATTSFDFSVATEQLLQSGLQCSSRIVSESQLLACSGKSHAIVDRSVDEFVVHYGVALLC